jgi:hypothetical protein
MNERLIVALAHLKADVPVSATWPTFGLNQLMSEIRGRAELATDPHSLRWPSAAKALNEDVAPGEGHATG